MSKAFDDIVRALDEDDLSVIKGFIIGTVNEKYGDLIRAMQDIEARSTEPMQSDEVIQVQVAGTLEALRAFATVFAEEQS